MAVTHDHLHGTFDSKQSEVDRLNARIAELERMDTENTIQIAKMNGYISVLEETQKWHRCDTPNEDGLYDLPPEDGEYIVEYVHKNGKGNVTSAEYNADYTDWDGVPFDCEVRQWRELPKAPEVNG